MKSRLFGLRVSPFLWCDTNLSKRPDPIVLFRSCVFPLDSFVESTGHRPIALSCGHPSGSGIPGDSLQSLDAASPVLASTCLRERGHGARAFGGTA